MRIICAAAVAFSVLGSACTRDPVPVKKAAEIATEASTPETLSAKADIPIYPGANLPEKQSNVRTDGQQTRFEIVMSTGDTPKQVGEFYTRELKMQAKAVESGQQLIGMTPKGNYAIINVSRSNGRTKVVAVSVAPK